MDDFQVGTVDLPKTAAAWEEGRTENLEVELDDDLAGRMLAFLDDSCESGGWPEDDQVTIDSVTLTSKRLTAEVTVVFTELIPSGCNDMPHREGRVARFVVTLERDEATAVVDYSPSDPNTWDQADRNSAGDGN